MAEETEFKHLDYLGHELKVGDRIVCIWHRDTSSKFVKRTIKKFTRCYVVTEDKMFPPDKVIKVADKKGNVADYFEFRR